MSDYYILDFIDQCWVVLDPTGEIVASYVTWEAAQNKMNSLNNERTLKEKS